MRSVLAALVLASVAALGCAGDRTSDGSEDDSEDAVVVDNRSPLARAQHRANLDFARSYQASCTRTPGTPSTQGRPRVLVAGFGRFFHIADNATGRIVSRLTGFEYPLTEAPPRDQIDPPAPQTRAGVARVTLPQAGDVDVCGMVLPVFWDLAPILIAREIEAFEPDLVIMNGVAGSRQALYIELGAINRAMRSTDGSNILAPYSADDTDPVLIAGGEPLRGLLMSWDEARGGALRALDAQRDAREGDVALGDVLTDVKLAGFPRGGNTYLCNNVTYVVNHLMAHPGADVTLLEGSDSEGSDEERVRISVSHDLRKTPRVFLHWPSDLVNHAALLDGATSVLKGLIDAQLGALRSPETAPTLGDNDRADPSLRGGEFF